MCIIFNVKFLFRCSQKENNEELKNNAKELRVCVSLNASTI